MKSINKKDILLVVLIFCIFVSYLLLTRFFIQQKNFSFIESLTKPRFDILEYRKIAVSGYFFTVTKTNNKPFYSGNLVWFPVYPLFLKVLILAPGPSLNIKTFVSSFILLLLSCLLLFYLVSARFGRLRGLLSVVALLAFPTSFYFLLGFPYSLLLALVLLYLHLLRKKRRLLARLLSVAISLTYPSGFLLIVVPVVQNFLNKKSLSGFIKSSAADIVFFISPVLILFTYYYLRFGDFWAFFRVQSSGFGRSFSEPFKFIRLIPEVLGAGESNRPEVLIILFLVFSCLLFLSKNFGVGLVLYFLAVILMSLSTGTITSVYRQYVILFPAAIWFAVSNKRFVVKLCYIIISVLLLNWYLLFYISGNLV